MSDGWVAQGWVENRMPSAWDLPLYWLGTFPLSYKSSFLHLLHKHILHGKTTWGLLPFPLPQLQAQLLSHVAFLLTVAFAALFPTGFLDEAILCNCV